MPAAPTFNSGTKPAPAPTVTQAQVVVDEKQEPRIEYRTEFVEVAVSNSADQRAWQIAKRKVLDCSPHKRWRPVELFRLVEEVKDLVLSGDPDGTIN